MQENNENEKVKKKSYFSNWSIKEFEQAVIGGLAFSLSLWLLPNSGSNWIACTFCIMTIFLMVSQKVCFSSTLRKNRKYEEEKYDCRIKDLMLVMYCGGLVLKEWGSNLYLFKTNNTLLPNDYFLVREYEEYCSILGQVDSLRRLESISLLIKKDNQNTKDNYYRKTE